MSEILKITNFAGIHEIEIDLKKINILIGPQATGKSVTAKLLFYFKDFIRDSISTIISSTIINEQSKQGIDSQFEEKFKKYFPPSTWGEEEFCIEYRINDKFH